MAHIGGPQAAEFVVVGGTPNRNISIPAGTTANVTLRCTPLGVGARNATLTVTHNDANAAGAAISPVTYNVTCNGLAAQPIYDSVPQEPNPANPGGTINFGPPGALNTPIVLPQALQITNNGSAILTLQNINLSGGDAADFMINNTPAIVNPGQTVNISLTCTPTVVGQRFAQLNLSHNDITSGVVSPASYPLVCEGSNTVPGYSSAPAPTNQLNINTTANAPGTANVVVSENGNAPLTVTSATVGAAPFSVTQGGAGFTINDGGPSQTITVQCLSATAGTFNTTLTVNHNAAGTPATYPVQCIVAGASGAGYSSNPAPGSTITINTPLNTAGTSTIVISENGTANLVITGRTEANTSTQISVTGPGLPITIIDGAGQPSTQTITCTSNTAGTFTETLTITHNAPGSPATYTINCTVSSATATTVQSATDTAATSTASAAVPATSVTQCPNNQVLSTPFPGNAAGEYLLVNCFTVSSQGTVSVTLALVLTNPSSSVGADDLTAIQASPANMLVYRQGSWFLTPSTYNAATQTYSFTSAAGANIYAFFFGTITEPVGSQGTAAFAGTTTGNAEDTQEINLDDSKRTPIAEAIVSFAVVFFLAAIFFSRRFKKAAETQSA